MHVLALWPGRLEQRLGSHAVVRQRLGGRPSRSSRSYSLTARVAATQPRGSCWAPVRWLAPVEKQHEFAAVASAFPGSAGSSG